MKECKCYPGELAFRRAPSSTLFRRVTLLAIIAVFHCAASASDIHRAVRDGDITTVRDLLRKDPDLVAAITSDDHSTPLHEAIRTGNVEIARALVAAKADVNAKTTLGLTPLKLAKGYSNTEMVRLLEANGAKLLEPRPKPVWTVPVLEPQQRASMPPYTVQLYGDKQLLVINSSGTTVSVRILSGTAGAHLYIASGSSGAVSLPAGFYEIYYIFSNEPSALHQGDNVTIPWNAATASIKIGVANGNHKIRRIN